MDPFFDEQKEQSRIKSRIVSEYFWSWAKVITSGSASSDRRLAFMDLFAGPGRYEDGTLSTPLLVLEKAIADQDLRERLIVLLNDRRTDFVASLRDAVMSLPGIETLKHKPQIEAIEVGKDIASKLASMRLVPTFLFVDPWGYKGLTLRLLHSVLRNWGCDCVFFFNYNRINPALNNDSVNEHINDLFEESRANSIRARLKGLQPSERESIILEELTLALKELGIRFVLPFTFKNEKGTRTSHHLVFATKHFKGLDIMKSIMARESSVTEQGVPSFAYSPAQASCRTLFDLNRPLDDLEEMLRNEFAGQRIRMRDLYERHSVPYRYLEANYKDVLVSLEAAGKISADPPAARRPKRHGKVTFGPDVVVTFPPRGAA